MATLQKFKLLATHCAVVAGSPTRSPSAGHLRRRTTLRHLLSRRHRNNNIPRPNPPQHKHSNSNNNNNNLKLKDLLLLSSPPSPEERVSPAPAAVVPRGGGGRRPLTATLRQRLMRRSWRPVLVSIPE